MWFGAIKLALNAGTHIYKKKKETQMLMADAQAQHASKMARGELEFSGKLLEARQNDYKDDIINQINKQTSIAMKLYHSINCFIWFW